MPKCNPEIPVVRTSSPYLTEDNIEQLEYKVKATIYLLEREIEVDRYQKLQFLCWKSNY
jgi:hypothetical protein